MSSVSCEELVQLESGSSVTLKKWSTRKFFFLIRLLGEVGKDLTSKLAIRIDKVVNPETGVVDERFAVNWDPKVLVELLLGMGDLAQAKLTAMIKESCVGSVTEDEILDWPPGDYIGALSKILEMNLTEQMRKNVLNLRDTFLKKIRGAA